MCFLVLLARQKNGQHGFLHMQAVLGFVKDLVGVLLEHGGGDLLARWAGRQCSTMASGLAASSSLPVSWKPTKSRRRCSLSGVPGLAVFHTAVATTSAS